MAITAAIVPALTPPTALLEAASPAALPPEEPAAVSSAASVNCGNKIITKPEMAANIFFENVFILKPI